MFPRLYTSKIFIFVFIIFTISLNANSDVIEFKNRQTIEGEIIEDNLTSIVVDVGAGKFTFKKDEIINIVKKAVKRDNKSINQDLKKREINYLVSKVRLKNRLIKKYKNINKVLEYKKHSIETDLATLYKKYNKFKDINNYNKIREKEINLKNINFKINTNHKKISTQYMDLTENMVSLESKYNEYIRRNRSGKNKLIYVNEMIKKYNKDWKSNRIPLRKNENGGLYLTAMINQKNSIDFLLDTGASTVIITDIIAKKLGIKEADKIKRVKCQIANGDIVEGDYVILNNVRVGNMSANNIAAIILSSEFNKKIEPLLGMSFLSNYFFQIDTVNNELILEYYSPR